jgi:Na+/H+-dicarboxylate symporter
LQGFADGDHAPYVAAMATASPSRWPSFGVQVLIGMAAGLALGLIARDAPAPWLGEALATIGNAFVQLLKAIVPPLVFTAIVASIANLGALTNAARLAWKTLLWFALTAGIAVAIGLALGLIIQPGHHNGVAASAAVAPSSMGGWTDFLKGLVPANFLGLSAATTIGADGAATSTIGINVLQLLVISIAIGIAAVKSGEAGAPFLAFVQSALVIVRKILWWIIRLTPIGTAGLIGHAVADYGWDALASLGWFALAVYLGLGLVLFVVYPALLALNGLSVRRFFAAAWPAIQLGFVSRSSIGTMPVTEEAVTGGLGVPRAYASFAVPLGATTKMDGCAAIYPAVSALFVAQFYGLTLGPADYVLIALVSVLGSAATAGVTGATVMLTLTLSTLGLPLEGAGLLLAIDPILDMGRTAVNVAGQALVPHIVAAREGLVRETRADMLPAELVPAE